MIILRVLIICLIFLSVWTTDQRLALNGSILKPASVYAQDDWKKEFEEVCSRTDDAMSLSKDELKALVARCDKLKPLIEKLDETEKKVYLRRLQLCRDLFSFVLESKEKN